VTKEKKSFITLKPGQIPDATWLLDWKKKRLTLPIDKYTKGCLHVRSQNPFFAQGCVFKIVGWCREEPTQLLSKFCGATTFSITTLSIKTRSIMGLFVTLSINDIQHNAFSFIMLSVVITLMVCWVPLCWVSWRQFCSLIHKVLLNCNGTAQVYVMYECICM